MRLVQRFQQISMEIKHIISTVITKAIFSDEEKKKFHYSIISMINEIVWYVQQKKHQRKCE